jgi:hypothetical protein
VKVNTQNLLQYVNQIDAGSYGTDLSKIDR